jgi:outer membrane protein assembly factor BamB
MRNSLLLWFLALIPGLSLAQTVKWRTPLTEGGQSGICVHQDQVYLTIHEPIKAPMRGGDRKSSDIIGQCFNSKTGKLKWQVKLPGSHAGTVMESWHDSTSLTPLATADCVVFQNVNGLILACDHAGKILWKREFNAPEPDIKNARLFVHNELLIVALPSKKEDLDIEKGEKSYRLPLYQLQGIELKTGTTRWTSPAVQNHATQYSIDTWKGKPIIVSSLINLTHYNFRRGNHGYLISPDDGSVLESFKLAACEPHYKNQLVNGRFLVSVKHRENTTFRFIEPTTGKVNQEIAFAKPDRYFRWNSTDYEQGEFKEVFTNKWLKGRKSPTASTMHHFGKYLFYFPTIAPCIGYVDTESGESTLIDVPVQIVDQKTRWKVEDIEFTKGIFNAKGSILRGLANIRGPRWGGFGHVNPADPVLRGDSIFWQGGIGMLYRIDLPTEGTSLTPQNVSWTSIDTTGSDWCFGKPGLGKKDEVYLRSQRQLVKLSWPTQETRE